MVYVIFADETGIPGQLIGPVFMERAVEIINKKCLSMNQCLSEKEKLEVEDMGCWEFENGETAWIIMGEEDEEE